MAAALVDSEAVEQVSTKSVYMWVYREEKKIRKDFGNEVAKFSAGRAQILYKKMGGFTQPPVQREKERLQYPHRHLTRATITPSIVRNRCNFQLLYFRLRR